MSEDRMIKVEEVESVEAPPKARVEDVESAPEKLERKRDYLDGFLAAKPAAVDPHSVGGDLYEAVINALKHIYDPQIPVNIHALRLLSNFDINDGHALVQMTQTKPHSPLAESMPTDFELRVPAVPPRGNAAVNLLWAH